MLVAVLLFWIGWFFAAAIVDMVAGVARARAGVPTSWWARSRSLLRLSALCLAIFVMAAQLAGGGAIEVWFARQGLAASACLAVGSVFGLLELTLARRLKLGSWLRRATWPRPSGFQVAMAMVLTGCLFVAGLGVVTALHR